MQQKCTLGFQITSVFFTVGVAHAGLLHRRVFPIPKCSRRGFLASRQARRECKEQSQQACVCECACLGTHGSGAGKNFLPGPSSCECASSCSCFPRGARRRIAWPPYITLFLPTHLSRLACTLAPPVRRHHFVEPCWGWLRVSVRLRVWWLKPEAWQDVSRQRTTDPDLIESNTLCFFPHRTHTYT